MFKALSALSALGLLVIILSVYLGDLFVTLRDLENILSPKTSKLLLLTPDELARYDGVKEPLLYLAILGNIYNVTKGAKHYGPGMSYHFFVGKDASRNFVTGQFEEEHASDDVIGLNHEEFKSLNHWVKFYRKEYRKVGKLIGRYYDGDGRLTQYAREIKRLLHQVEQKEESNQLEKRRFPPCNIEWDPVKGSRVWCTERSGGIPRTWVGKPRLYFEAGSAETRCVCVTQEDESSDRVKEYPGCDKNSDSCFVEV